MPRSKPYSGSMPIPVSATEIETYGTSSLTVMLRGSVSCRIPEPSRTMCFNSVGTRSPSPPRANDRTCRTMFALRQLSLQQPHRDHHRGQDVVEVVRQSPGQGSGALEALRAQQLSFGATLLGDVAQDDGEELLAADLDLGDRGFDRELLAVRAQTEQRVEPTHRTARDVGLAEGADVSRMRGAESPRNEAIERLAERFSGRGAERLFRRAVEHENTLVLVDGDDGVHSRADDAGEQRLAVVGDGAGERIRLANVGGVGHRVIRMSAGPPSPRRTGSRSPPLHSPPVSPASECPRPDI